MSYTGSTVLVTFATIEQAQSDVTATVNAINQETADLQSYLAPMISSWSGQARDNYYALQTKWNNATADLVAVLAQIATALGDAYTNYTQTELANGATWAQ